MAGFVQICSGHDVLCLTEKKDVDHRDKPGDDGA
jgi:hypothetical protein